MRVPIFAETIQKCQDALSSQGIDVKKIITTDDDTIYDDILNTYIGIAAVELGLTEILKKLGLKPDYLIGLYIVSILLGIANYYTHRGNFEVSFL